MRPVAASLCGVSIIQPDITWDSVVELWGLLYAQIHFKALTAFRTGYWMPRDFSKVGGPKCVVS